MRKKLLIFVLSIIVCGCGNNNQAISSTITPTIPTEYIDRSFLTNELCKAPCWFDLEVNKSNRDDVMSVITSLSFLNSDNTIETRISYFDEIREENFPATLLNVECMAQENTSCATFIFVDNLLKTIMLSPNYSISFLDAVETLGEPSFVRIWPDINNTDDCDIALQWTDNLIEVVDIRAGLNNPNRCANVFNGLGVSEELSVDVISYIAPEDPILIRNPGDGGQPWEGFIND